MKLNKFVCTGMITYSDGKTKAIAQVTVNDEFVIKGFRVYEGANGAYAMPPSKLVDPTSREYRSIVYPITSEARRELLDTVVRTYNNLCLSGADRLPLAKEEPGMPFPESSENPELSDIFVTLEKSGGAVKAIGKAVINNSIVISDIRVAGYKDASGEEKLFVGMPSYKNSANEYKDMVYITSSAFREKLHNTVMSVYEKMIEKEDSKNGKTVYSQKSR